MGLRASTIWQMTAAVVVHEPHLKASPRPRRIFDLGVVGGAFSPCVQLLPALFVLCWAYSWALISELNKVRHLNYKQRPTFSLSPTQRVSQGKTNKVVQNVKHATHSSSMRRRRATLVCYQRNLVVLEQAHRPAGLLLRCCRHHIRPSAEVPTLQTIHSGLPRPNTGTFFKT